MVIGVFHHDLKVNTMRRIVQKMGILRVILLVLAILLAISMIWVDTSLPPEGLGLLRAAVLPALAPIVFMVLLLDLLMCQVLKADQDTGRERRMDLNFISKCHLIAATLLLVSWLPIFLRATYL